MVKDGESKVEAEKRKVTFDEMLVHLENKGVLFEKYNKKEAKNFLQSNNYYFKLTSYRKNFRSKNGQYQNLDFKHLVDLASIDMQVRYLILRMCLDLEHLTKTMILKDLTNDPTEDGYSIVKDFALHTGVTEAELLAHANKKLRDKHVDKLSVWVMLEVSQFGQFTEFLEFYYNRKSWPRRFKDLKGMMKFVKNLRNAAAHNSCIINSITEKNQIKPYYQTSNFVSGIPGISKSNASNQLTNKRIHDLSALFYLYDNYVSSERMKQARYQEMSNILKRCRREAGLYDNNQALKGVYIFLRLTVVFLKRKV